MNLRLIKQVTTAVGIVFLAAPAVAHSQDSLATLVKKGNPESAKLYEYDTSVPAAPALALVEGAPELSVTSPFGPDLVADAALTGERIGGSIAARPYWVLGFGDNETLGTYREPKKWPTRVMARTTFSAAGAPRIANGEHGLGAGLGLHTEFLDRADPRFNTAHLSCLQRATIEFSRALNREQDRLEATDGALQAARRAAKELKPSLDIGVLNTKSSIESIEDLLRPDDVLLGRFEGWRSQYAADKIDAKDDSNFKSIRDDCFKRGALAAENSPSFQLGIGTSWSAATFDTSDLKSDGASVWTALRIPMPVGGRSPCGGDNAPDEVSYSVEDKSKPLCVSPAGNFTAFGNYVSDDKVTAGGVERSAATLQSGLVFSRKARNNLWSFAASAVWNERDFKGAGLKTDRFARYGLSFQVKADAVLPSALGELTKDLWIDASGGRTSGLSTSKEDNYVLIRIIRKG